MTRDEIIRMAEENGIVIVGEAMFRFAALVAAAEREACALVCEAIPFTWTRMDYEKACVEAAKAIRARAGE